MGRTSVRLCACVPPVQERRARAKERKEGAERAFAEWSAVKTFKDAALACLEVIPKPSVATRALGHGDNDQGGHRTHTHYTGSCVKCRGHRVLLYESVVDDVCCVSPPPLPLPLCSE